MNGGFLLGDRVILVCGAVPATGNGVTLPAGALGTVVGYTRYQPQIDFGDGSPKIVPVHFLELVDLPDGAPLPNDGEVFSWDVYIARFRANGGV